VDKLTRPSPNAVARLILRSFICYQGGDLTFCATQLPPSYHPLLRTMAQQEYDKHHRMRKGNEGKKVTPPAFQFLDIYEIVSIKRVAGGIRITQPHSETSTRPRGAAAGKQGARGRDDSEESEDEEWLPVVATSVCGIVWRIDRASKLAMKRLAASIGPAYRRRRGPSRGPGGHWP